MKRPLNTYIVWFANGEGKSAQAKTRKRFLQLLTHCKTWSFEGNRKTDVVSIRKIKEVNKDVL